MPITRRNFFRNLAAGAAVTAGFPPLADLASSEPGGPIILSRNENAYGPSQKVIASMQE
jgi:histidinol-phosphate/aromatic aminotransferase/cobyric acid decarboxylase-like protein